MLNQVLAQFRNAEGHLIGGRLMIPQDVTPLQLDLLLFDQIKDNSNNPCQYSYFVDEKEILKDLVSDIGDSFTVEGGIIRSEKIIEIVYRPKLLFNVKPITRTSSTISGHSGSILSVLFSPNSNHLVSGSGDSTVRFWDLNTETLISTGNLHKGWVLCLSWSPDSKYVASGSSDNSIYIWDVCVGSPIGKPLTGHSGLITCLCWEPIHLTKNCSLLASGSRDGTFRVWNPISSTCLYTLSQHQSAITSLKWGHTGYIYGASRDRTVSIWKDGRIIKLLKGHSHWINTLSLSTDQVNRNNVDSERMFKEVTMTEKLVTGSDDSTLILWPQPLDNDSICHRLIGHQGVVNHVSFSPDGRLIASASFDRSIRIWNGIDGTLLTIFRGHVGSVYLISWSPDSRMVVSCSKDTTLKIWNVDHKRLEVNLPGHLDEVYAVDWSPDGARVASGGKDKMLKIWKH
jgi:ribosome assembly protein 4